MVRDDKVEESHSLERLVGEEVNGVCFIMDYVELHFNGPILRALTAPVIRTEQGQWLFPASGSRDALCGLVGKTVASVVAQDAISLRCAFESGESLTIPLDEASRTGPEAAHFVPGPNQPIAVW